MEESKYYTPSIEDFHVGFEYESAVIDCQWSITGWNKRVVEPTDDFRFLKDFNYLSRVKKLDKGDVLYFGFKKKTKNKTVMWDEYLLEDINPKIGHFLKVSFYLPKFEEDDCIIVLHRSEIFTDEDLSNDDARHVFRGKIRNRSELKKLLKMLNIL